MIQPVDKSSEQGLVDTILADAENQVNSLLDEAGAEARAVLEQSEKEAAAIEEKILAKAKLDADAFTARTCAKARVEARRALLQAREEAIAKVLGRIEKALQDIRGDTLRYRAALMNLITEAILGIENEHVVVVLGATDMSMVDDSLLENVKNRVNERSGGPVSMELQFQDSDLGGGAIAMEPGGRVRLDNSFPQRLKEAKHKLNSLIIAEIEKNCG